MDNPQRLEDPTLVGQIINGLFENDVISRTAGDTAEEPPDERLQRLRAVTTGVIADALHRREIANSVQRPIPCELSIKYRGEKHTSDVLDSEDCLKYIKMSGPALRSLCQMLDTNQLIDKTWNISTEQKLMLFFCVFAQNMTYDTIRVQFHRSVNTTHRAVNEAMAALVRAGQKYVVMPPASYSESALSGDRDYWPFFQGCIGAVDTVQFPIVLPLHQQAPWRNRDGYVSQNVLISCDFDCNFTFLYSGMQGSCNDQEVIGKAMGAKDGLVARMPKDCFLLGDMEFNNCNCIMAPYPGTIYNLEELRTPQGTPVMPKNPQELFNMRHSRKRICIERNLAILKRRFRSLHIPREDFSLAAQIDLVHASIFVHNFLNQRGEVIEGIDEKAVLTK